MKKPRLSSPQPPVPATLHTAAGVINNASLSNPEVSAVRQLIIGTLVWNAIVGCGWSWLHVMQE